jgi:hypothetical protein
VSYKSARLLTLLGSGVFVLIGAMFIGFSFGADTAESLSLGLAVAILGCTLLYASVRIIDSARVLGRPD